MGQIDEQELQSVFIRGMKNEELKKETSRYTCQNKSANLEDQVEYATSIETSWKNASDITVTCASEDEAKEQPTFRHQTYSKIIVSVIEMG